MNNFIFNQVKIYIIICWACAFLINLFPADSGLISAAGFFIICVFLFVNRTVKFNGYKKKYTALLILLILINATLNNHNNQLAHVIWYIFVANILYLCSLTAQLNKKNYTLNNHLSSSPVDLLVILIIFLSATSSYLFFTNGFTLINPNVATPLLSVLFIIYYMSLTVKNYNNANIFKIFIISITGLTILAQQSRTVLFWLLILLLCINPHNRKIKFISKILITAFISFTGFTCFLLTEYGVDYFSDINGLILNLPAILRLKDGGIESDALRLIHYPLILSREIDGIGDLVFGLGFGKRQYLGSLAQGENLHNAFLVIISDGGLFLLSIILALILITGRHSYHLFTIKRIIFFSSVTYSGILLGLAPLTLTLAIFYIYLNIYLNKDKNLPQ